MRRGLSMYWGLNRSLCNVLDEMRACDKTRNYSPLPGLIEEAQVMGNRMEAGLSDKSEIEEWSELRSKMKKEYKALKKEIEELEQKKNQLKGEESSSS